MDSDPVESKDIAQGNPEATTDTDSDMNGSSETLHLDSSSEGSLGKAELASRERIREETWIVVLDFLSSLPADKLTARNLVPKEKKRRHLSKSMQRLSKSSSDVGSYEHKRQKFLQMARLQRKLSLNLKKDIENFDPKTLKQRSQQKNEDFSRRPSDLKIPSAVPGNHSNNYDHSSSPVLSPEGRVAARLEKISQDIMEMVPHLMDEPLEIMRGGSLSYEQFSVAARHLTFDHQIVGWSKVALLCHFAREVAIMGELDDSQLELLAEYSFKFIQESTTEWIEKKGGWAAFDAENENDIRNAQILLQKFLEKEEKDGNGKDSLKHKRFSGSASNRNSWDSWFKYGVAAAAIGIGVCLSLVRQ